MNDSVKCDLCGREEALKVAADIGWAFFWRNLTDWSDATYRWFCPEHSYVPAMVAQTKADLARSGAR